MGPGIFFFMNFCSMYSTHLYCRSLLLVSQCKPVDRRGKHETKTKAAKIVSIDAKKSENLVLLSAMFQDIYHEENCGESGELCMTRRKGFHRVHHTLQ
jgi:hypothetical protein